MPQRSMIDRLGDIGVGRRTLGPSMPVVVYRLFEYSTRDVLTQAYGYEAACDLLRRAGYKTGGEFAKNVLDLSGDFDFFIAGLTRALKELQIGYLLVEQADFERMHFVLTISEDLDCSGLPVINQTVCHYDEGFIAGVMEAYTGRVFDVREIDCWANGGTTCRFEAKVRV